MFSTVNLVSLSNKPLLFPMLQQVWICLTLVLLKLAEKIFSHSLSICTYTPSRLCQNIGIQRSAYVKSIYNSILFPQANSAAIQSFSLYNLVQSCHFLIFFFFFTVQIFHEVLQALGLLPSTCIFVSWRNDLE